MFYQALWNCMFLCCYYLSIANYWWLGSTSQLLSSIWMTPPWHLLIPWVSGVMVSIIAFRKLCSGAKTLGWEHSNGTLKMISKTLE
jgi:hypothetical protein